jgi:hypothetical protein
MEQQRKNYETEEELIKDLELLGITDEEQKKEMTCALIGHSRIQSYFFGYYNCGRCGDQLGDSWAGSYSNAEKVVIIGHDCPVCRKNYETMTWKDKLFCPDPFTKPAEEENKESEVDGE